MSKVYNITIDGPAGAGKSTIAKAVSAELGFVYVDTGAMYRAMALYFMRRGIKAEEEERISEAVKETRVAISYENGVQQVFLNGENVSDLIRSEEVSRLASVISAYMPVREKLVKLQKELAGKENIVMDGRDIGTCVLPGADLKIYLTADTRVRAKRRCSELTAKGEPCSLPDIEKEIDARDYRDMNREYSPLKPAEDAVIVDTSGLTVGEAVGTILKMAGEKGVSRLS